MPVGLQKFNAKTLSNTIVRLPYFGLVNLLAFTGYYVRVMAAQVNSQLEFAHEILQNYAIANTLAIDDIINDFKLNEPSEADMDNLLRSLGSGKD